MALLSLVRVLRDVCDFRLPFFGLDAISFGRRFCFFCWLLWSVFHFGPLFSTSRYVFLCVVLSLSSHSDFPFALSMFPLARPSLPPGRYRILVWSVDHFCLLLLLRFARAIFKALFCSKAIEFIVCRFSSVASLLRLGVSHTRCPMTD